MRVAVKGTRGNAHFIFRLHHNVTSLTVRKRPMSRSGAGNVMQAAGWLRCTVHRPPCVLSSSIINRTHSHTEPPNFNRAVLFPCEITDRGLPVISRCPARSHPAGLGPRARSRTDSTGVRHNTDDWRRAAVQNVKTGPTGGVGGMQSGMVGDRPAPETASQ